MARYTKEKMLIEGDRNKIKKKTGTNPTTGPVLGAVLGAVGGTAKDKKPTSPSNPGGGGGGSSFDINGLIADIQKAIDAQYQTEEDAMRQQSEMVKAAILDAIEKEKNRYSDTETNLHTSRDSSIEDMRENVQTDALRRGMARSSYSVDNATENEAEIRKQVETLVGQALRDMNTNVSSYEKQQTLNDQALATNIVGLIRRREAEKAAQGSQMRYSHFMATRPRYGGGGGYDILGQQNAIYGTPSSDTAGEKTTFASGVGAGIGKKTSIGGGFNGNFNPSGPSNPNHQYYKRSNATSWGGNHYDSKKEKEKKYKFAYGTSVNSLLGR